MLATIYTIKGELDASVSPAESSSYEVPDMYGRALGANVEQVLRGGLKRTGEKSDICDLSKVR